MASVHPRGRAAYLAAALFVSTADSAAAQAPVSLSDAEICLAANRSLSLGAPLPRTTARLNAGDPLRIVAVGSSSTTGLWVLSSAATYPEVMRRELARLRPSARVEIINSVFYQNSGAVWISPAIELDVQNSLFFGSGNGQELVWEPVEVGETKRPRGRRVPAPGACR